MWYVYVIRSRNSNFVYIGSTNDLERRLAEHNNGLGISTKAYRPFIVEAYVAVRTESKGRELEKYFKTGLGKAVLKKRILNKRSLGVVSFIDEASAKKYLYISLCKQTTIEISQSSL